MGFLEGFLKKKPKKAEPPEESIGAPPAPEAEAPAPVPEKPVKKAGSEFFAEASSPEEALALACAACEMGEKALFFCEEKLSPNPQQTIFNWSVRRGLKAVEKQKEGLLHIFVLKEKAEKPGMKEKRIMKIVEIVDEQKPGTVAICVPFITPELRHELELRKVKTVFAPI